MIVAAASACYAQADAAKPGNGGTETRKDAEAAPAPDGSDERPEFDLFRNVAPGTRSTDPVRPTPSPERYTPTPVCPTPSTSPVRPRPVDTPAPEPVPPPAGDPVVELYRKSAPGIVRIVVKRGDEVVYGSGFILGGKGVIVTSFHLIEGASRGVVTFHDGINLLVDGVLACDVKQDLALIKVDVGDMALQPLALALDPPTVGSKVLALGNPEGFFGTVADGRVTDVCAGDKVGEKYTALASDMVAAGEVEWVITDATISVGNSGGPLVGEDGKVVGLGAWSWQADDLSPRVGFAASARKIMDLVGRAELTPKPLEALTAEQFGEAPAKDAVATRQASRTALKFGSDWKPAGKLPQGKVAQEIGMVLSSTRCRRCTGTGTVTIEVLREGGGNPAFSGVKRHVSKDVPCPDCGGSGQLITDLTYVRLVRMVDSLGQLNTQSLSGDSLKRTLDAARDVLAKVAAGSPAELRTKGQLPSPSADGTTPAIGQAAVFYGTLLTTFTKGGKRISLARAQVDGKPVLVCLPDGCEPVYGRPCLIAGLSAGVVTVQTEQGIHRERGVEAFACEPVPAGR
ncbi:MAG TPA: trypsin-like peptidase domain-containing protein [Phycisphaerae bacterium]|nr:trypsin-like serine protease [Phycisphaerae bacterium]HOI54924.1 trypsin-like peptidase domain-containing protein [Phycisphaerae bacterium]